MLLYICPQCGYWGNMAIAEAISKAFSLQPITYTCPTCNIAMTPPDPSDRLHILPSEVEGTVVQEEILALPSPDLSHLM